jgi:NADPH2:quinone reductase
MMQAVRVHAWGEAPRVDAVDRPVAGAGETLVKVEAAALAHFDLTVAGGNFGIKPDLPYVGGVEGCGVVVESDTLAPGTRVVLRGGGLGIVRPGTWAEYVTAKTKTLTPLPDGLSPEIGATFWVPTTTAHTALHAIGRLGEWALDDVDGAEQETVVVGGGAGAVGSMVVQLALRAGARVIALVTAPEQADLVPAGAEVLTPADAERQAELAESRSATLFVDTLGGPDLTARARWVRPGGRAVLIGYVTGTDVRLDLANWLLDDVALLPVNMVRREPEARALAPELAEMMVRGELTLNVETFPLADTGHALELLASGKVRGRAVIAPGRD